MWETWRRHEDGMMAWRHVGGMGGTEACGWLRGMLIMACGEVVIVSCVIVLVLGDNLQAGQ